MSSGSKRQQTMAKRNRELAVKERRALKLAKKHAAAAERNAEKTEGMFPAPVQDHAAPAEPTAEATEGIVPATVEAGNDATPVD